MTRESLEVKFASEKKEKEKTCHYVLMQNR